MKIMTVIMVKLASSMLQTSQQYK